MESLLLNIIGMNFIGIYCFWSYVAERNIVDFIDPLRNQIEWPNTVSIVWGPLRFKRRKKVSSGVVVTWREVCLVITTCFYAAWGFGKNYRYFFELLKGIMPQHLPEQILQRIVRLSTDGNSQQEVARMLGGIWKMHKQNFVTQLRDWPTTSEEAWRFDENLHATGRPSTAPKGQNDPLHLGSSSVNADDLPIWEVEVSSNHSEMASGCRILVSASSQMS